METTELVLYILGFIAIGGFAWYLPRTSTTTRIITGKIFIVLGLLLTIGATIGFFVDSSANPVISLGVLIRSLVASVIAVPWGVKLVQQANTEKARRIARLYCPTCIFFNKKAAAKRESHCDAPQMPEIRGRVWQGIYYREACSMWQPLAEEKAKGGN